MTIKPTQCRLFAVYALSDLCKNSIKTKLATSSIELIAIGKPSSPMQGIDNAIVFAGEKRSYLVQGVNQP